MTNQLLPSNHQLTTRNPLNLSSFDSNLLPVIGRTPFALIVLHTQPSVGNDL